MRKLRAFHHYQGAHCGSTALNDVARFHGQRLTEPLCLGLGEGLGFTTVEQAGASPSRMLLGRSRHLERRFFERVGVPFAWREDDDNERAWESAKSCIDRDVPVLLRLDLHYLPYYKSKTHFSGHVVVLAGYDEAGGTACLADTHFPDLQTVGLADLKEARTSPYGIGPVRNHAFPVEPFAMPADWEPLVRGAVVGQALRMLDGKDRGPVKTGVLAMSALAETFPAWKNAPDWQWCARFGYQIIEKRGTGGGNFRKLYSEFLSQAASHMKGADLPAMAREMAEIADRWSALAGALKAVSEADAPEGFEEAGRMMGDIAAREEAFYTRASALGR